ncbi:MAG: sulfatase family protein [Candidatus Sumerlaeaceae bacterium]
MSVLLLPCSIGLAGDHSAGVSASTPPNIIVILADDLGYGDLGCFGNTEYQTPCLDKMSSEGVRLTQFYVASGACSPSRAAFLTGKYPLRAGVPRVLGPKSTTGLPPEEITLAEILKKRGYATQLVGKWHLGHQPKFLPTRQGFDHYFGIPYSNDMKPAPLMRDTRIIEQTIDQTQLTPRYTEEALRFIDEQTSAARPFFLYFAHNYPHVPLHASEKFKGRNERLYGDVMQELDWSVGQVMDRLRALRQEKNTLVIFFSDNGPWLIKGRDAGSAGPMRDGKGTQYEGGIRVPCIAWWPTHLPAGESMDAPAIATDLLPTICRVTGAPLPERTALDGEDIFPLLEGTGSPSKRTLFFPDYYGHDHVGAVRDGDWKLITEWRWQEMRGGERGKTSTRETTEPELYNIAADPREAHNLAAEHPDKVKSLTLTADAMRRKLDADDPWQGIGDPKTTESLDFVTPGTKTYMGSATAGE